MPRVNEYTFTARNRPSEEVLERWARFLPETLASYHNQRAIGTVRRLSPEETRPAVDSAPLAVRREAS